MIEKMRTYQADLGISINSEKKYFLLYFVSDLMWEKFVGVIEKKIEAEGLEFTKFLRSLENFVLTVKQNTFWNRILFELVTGDFNIIFVYRDW